MNANDALTVEDLDMIAADLAPEVAACFAGASDNVRLYLAGAAVVGTLTTLRASIAAAVAGDRNARKNVIDNAAYWLARWTRRGAVN